MATPQAVTAVIRAARPDFRSTADKVAFAVHAIVSVNGFSLRMVGEGVDAAVAPGPAALPSEEAELAGWNLAAQEDGGTYAFLYVAEQGAHRPRGDQQEQQQSSPAAEPLLLVKCLRLSSGAGEGSGEQLLVSLADVASAHPPASLDLEVERYAPTLTGGYEQLPGLISRVEGALADALEGPQAAGAGKAAAAAATATTTNTTNTASTSGRDAAQRQPPAGEERQGQGQGQGGPRPDPLRDPLRDERFPGGVGSRGPPGWQPSGIGDEDLMPGGLPRPPGMGGALGGPGLMPLGPRGLGGGMHVGPENPIFADRLRHPRPGGPGGLFPGGPGGPGGGGGVPGMRWDPINPEGLQGWNPDDFTRGGRGMREEGLDDIGRPAPGRGPDWDNMFG